VATYTDPVAKSWAMDSYEDFAEGTTNGTELENPNYQGKIILECLLGVNKLGPTEKDWNPSFEDLQPGSDPPRPREWRFEFPSTGSTYEQNDPEGAYEGDDYVKLADEGPEGRKIKKVGRLILHPEEGSPNQLEIDADPQKTFTIRYHGRYENPEEIRFRGPGVKMLVEEDEVQELVEFDPFTEGDEYPDYWERSDYRLPPSEGTPEGRI
jgi:hypothetical protein